MPSAAFKFAVTARTIALSWDKYCAEIDQQTTGMTSLEACAYYKERRDFLDDFWGRDAFRYIKRMKLQSARPLIVRNLRADTLRCTEMMNHHRYGTPRPRF